MPEFRLVGDWLAIHGDVWFLYLIFLFLTKRWRHISCPLCFFVVSPLSRCRIFPICVCGLHGTDQTGDELPIRAAAVSLGSVDLAVPASFILFSLFFFT